MTEDEILAEVVRKEGGFRAAVTRPDGSVDPDTNHGITAVTLGNWRGLGRAASREEVRNLTIEEAREIYRRWYIVQPGFTKENIPFEPLRVQLIDFGVNSGPERAIRWLQRVLRLDVTGTLDSRTILYLIELPRTTEGPAEEIRDRRLRLVNDALCAARLYMIDQAVDQGIIRKQDEEGLESRALKFFLAKP